MVTCGTFYRPDASRPGGEQEQELTVPLEAWTPDGHSVSYEAMSLNAFYVDPMAEGVSFRLQVLAADGTELRSVLYQLGRDGLPNFSSQGFTGLHDVYEAGAMLQCWCTVPEP